VAARGSHAPPALARAAVKSNQKQGGQKWLSPLFSSLPAATTPLPAKHPKRNKQVCFSLVFRSASLPFPFSNLVRSGSLDLLHCRSVSFGHPLLLLCFGRRCWPMVDPWPGWNGAAS